VTRSPPARADNPIFTAEQQHLERASFRQSRWLTRLSLGVFAVALLLAGALSLLGRSGSLTTVNLRETYTFFSDLLRAVNVALLALLFLQHLLFVSRALLLASATIAREKETRAWDSLILTNVTARQLVYGKYAAVLAVLFHQQRVLLLLRGAAMLWFGLQPGGNWLFTRFASPDVLSALAAAVVLPLFSVANVALAAALGLVASLLVRTSGAAFRLGMVLHGGVVLAGLVIQVILLILFGFSALSVGGLRNGFTPVDGGLWLSLELMGGAFRWADILLVMVSLTLYLALTLGALLLARSLAARQGASPF